MQYSSRVRRRDVAYKGWRDWCRERITTLTGGFAVLVVLVGAFLYRLNATLYTLDEQNIEMHRSTNFTPIAPGEGTTIRLVAPKSSDVLERFIEDHAHCDYVKSIQVVWYSVDKPPIIPKVVFDTQDPSRPRYLNGAALNTADREPQWAPSVVSSKPFETESVLIMDAELTMSCADIKVPPRSITTATTAGSSNTPSNPHAQLMYRTWRSAKTSMGVGAFPRLHAGGIRSGSGSSSGLVQTRYAGAGPDDAGAELSLHTGWRVWWNGAYSVLLPLVFMTSREHVHSFNRAARAVDREEGGSVRGPVRGSTEKEREVARNIKVPPSTPHPRPSQDL